jgi:hypothetical protein
MMCTSDRRRAAAVVVVAMLVGCEFNAMPTGDSQIAPQSIGANSGDVKVLKGGQDKVIGIEIRGDDTENTSPTRWLNESSLRTIRLIRIVVDDASLTQMAKLPSLEQVTFEHCTLRGNLATLSKNTRLQKIVFMVVNVDMEDVSEEWFSSESPLTDVYLPHVSNVSSRMGVIARLPSLEVLSVAYSDITDADVQRLRNLDRLRSLNVTKTRLTDDSLKHLEQMSTLRTLFIDLNSDLTDAAIARLRNANPELDIYADGR